ncbi:MAG: TetR/AcrR family transcriptional regulator [Actinomycetota bacterium]|nr:TetR/AcrR family transcriptional regulator [Actinomycetota bacterium]MDH5223524.1 TetR/AcrR family transcriptional regulator [Actinomycetota bacterium]MDH5314310.1 TetR/AcrR family transcriptional regulator [Actinomycetota bacterium]
MIAQPKAPRNAKTQVKRDRIVDAAMRQFAEQGYQGAKVEDIAAELGIAKGSIFQHFGSKAGLFLQAYKRAVLLLPSWQDAPDDVRSEGFFATVRFWLDRTEHLIKEDWIPNRVVLIGNYGTDLVLKREINRWLVSEDPYGTLEFVEWGQQRGEVRTDVDLEIIVSMVDWLSNSLQDALVTEELDPGLFHRLANQPERQRMRVEHFETLLESALAAPVADSPAP